MQLVRSIATSSDQMAAPTRRSSINPQNHPLFSSESEFFSLTFSLNCRAKIAHSLFTSKIICFVVKQGCCHRHAHRQPRWGSNIQDKNDHSIDWGRLAQCNRLQENSRFLVMNQVLPTRRVHMIRCCSKITFRSFCFNQRTMSNTNQQNHRLSNGSFFRFKSSSSGLSSFLCRGSDIIISSETFIIIFFYKHSDSNPSRTTSTSATSADQEKGHWKANTIGIRDQHDQLNQGRRLRNR